MEHTTILSELPLQFDTYEPDVRKNIEGHLKQLTAHERQIYLLYYRFQIILFFKLQILILFLNILCKFQGYCFFQTMS